MSKEDRTKQDLEELDVYCRGFQKGKLEERERVLGLIEKHSEYVYGEFEGSKQINSLDLQQLSKEIGVSVPQKLVQNKEIGGIE